MALKLLGRDKRFQAQHIIEFAAKCDIPHKVIERALDEVTKGIAKSVLEFDQTGLSEAQVRHLREEVSRKIDAL